MEQEKIITISETDKLPELPADYVPDPVIKMLGEFFVKLIVGD